MGQKPPDSRSNLLQGEKSMLELRRNSHDRIDSSKPVMLPGFSEPGLAVPKEDHELNM